MTNELKAAQRDAERYRYWRNKYSEKFGDADLTPENFDSVTDAQMLMASALTQPVVAATQGVEAMSVRDWKTPTTFMQRFGDAMQALCHGHRPSREMMIAWLATDSEDNRLQAFACQYGFAWAQGIGLIDAACAAADQPTEGVDHKRRTPHPAPAAQTEAV